MQENFPTLVANNPLKLEFKHLQKIAVKSEHFTIGRGLDNSVTIAYLSISRHHCIINKQDNEWIIEDQSAFGIEINGNKLGKGKKHQLSHKDIISLEPSDEFIFEFNLNDDDDFEPQKKKKKLEPIVSKSDIMNTAKIKFEESQNYVMQLHEEKIQNAKQMQTTSMVLKQQLEQDMNRKTEQLEAKYQLQIQNLNGEKEDIKKQKNLLLHERDVQLTKLKSELGGQITELMEQIMKHNVTESELLKENNTLKENLQKEREEFLAELNRESSSKQEMLEKLEAKIKEQEETRLKETNELQEQLKKETELLKIAKENELRELEEQKKQKEMELMQELNLIKKKMKVQIEQTEQEKLKAEKTLIEQTEQINKLKDKEKVKMEQLAKEKEEYEKKLAEAEMNTNMSIEKLRAKEKEEYEKKLAEAEINTNMSIEKLRTEIAQRETELAALAADRIQKNVEQSSEVISSLQQQLEKVKNQLQNVENEKNILLENLCLTEPTDGISSKHKTLAEVGELMESELQCSICAELFIGATTLNCSHTFCKYCITMWLKKKKECPNCRSPITSECKSLVLDTFIEKMVLNLTDDMKKKRDELLKSREEEVVAMTTPTVIVTTNPRTRTRTRGRSRRNTRTSTGTNSRTNTFLTTTATTMTSVSTSHGGTGGLVASTAIVSPSTQVIPTVDLTRMVSMSRLTYRTLPPHQQELTTMPLSGVVYRIEQGQAPRIVMVEAEDGDDASMLRVFPENITAGTDAVTRVVPAVTGPRVAPSDSTQHRRTRN